MKNIVLIKSLKIFIIYLFVGTLWVYFSDTLLRLLVKNIEVITTISIYKGIAYIILSGILIQFLVYSNFRKVMEAEELLNNERKILKMILNNSYDGILLFNTHLSMLFSNDKITQLCGIQLEEFTNIEKVFALLLKNNEISIKICKEILDGVTINGKIVKRNISLNDNGVIQIIDIHAVKLGDGKLLITFVEVTEQKEMERNLKKSEESYKKILETAEEGILIIKENGSILFSNRKMAEMVEYENGILDKMSFFDLIRPKLKKLYKDYLELCVHSGRWKNDLEFISKNNKAIWTIVTSTPIYDDEFNYNGILLMITDITARKEAENDMAKAKEVAEVANKAKSQFLANMSHEMRTPLNGIMGMEYLLSQTNLDESQREYLGMLKLSAEMLLQIINDVLDLSQIESNKFYFQEIEFAIEDVVDDTLKIVEKSAAKKGIKILTEIDKKIDYNIIIDPKYVEQILMNLLGNAIKFTNKGEVSVTVKELSKAEVVYLQISIKDSGIGIPEDKLDKIFETFFQIDTSTTKRFGGTGLGLAIVKKLIEYMNGKIHVESTVNVGSNFIVEIPFKYVERVKSSLKTEVIDDEDIPKSGKCILIVEDNEINLSLIQQLLYKKGYECETIENGMMAVEACKEKKYNLILMDIQMPEMNGYQATELIRTNIDSKNKKSPIIALTAYAMEEDKTKCLEIGMNDYLAKPFRADEFYNLVEKYTK